MVQGGHVTSPAGIEFAYFDEVVVHCRLLFGHMIGFQEQVPGDAEKFGGIRKANLAQVALGPIPDRRLLLVRKIIIEAPRQVTNASSS